MTSFELYNKVKPSNVIYYPAQFYNGHLEVNTSDIFCRLIKDAARCNGFSSDVYYSLKEIDEFVNEFNPEEEYAPIWVAFRKLGVDHTGYVLIRANETNNVWSDLSRNYFALYSLQVRKEDADFYKLILSEYSV